MGRGSMEGDRSRVGPHGQLPGGGDLRPVVYSISCYTWDM